MSNTTGPTIRVGIFSLGPVDLRRPDLFGLTRFHCNLDFGPVVLFSGCRPEGPAIYLFDFFFHECPS